MPGYTEVRGLGAGSHGRVVLAWADDSGEPVAIRYVPMGLLVDRPRAEQFWAELAALAGLDDPRVARLRDYAEDPRVARPHLHVGTGDGAAIVCDVVDGVSLRRVLHQGRVLSAEAALTVLKGSLLGLAAAHALPVVHREHRPATIMVTRDGSCRLTGFGVAILSREGMPPGTPAYWAPELWSGSSPTPTTDVYAATCVFFECLTGRLPYPAAGLYGLMGQHMAAPVPVRAVPEPLRELVSLGLAKDAAQRPEAGALVARLEATALSAYGPDWERRGLAELADAVAPHAHLFPLAGLTISPGSHTAANGPGAAPGRRVSPPSGSLTGSRQITRRGPPLPQRPQGTADPAPNGRRALTSSWRDLSPSSSRTDNRLAARRTEASAGRLPARVRQGRPPGIRNNLASVLRRYPALTMAVVVAAALALVVITLQTIAGSADPQGSGAVASATPTHRGKRHPRSVRPTARKTRRPTPRPVVVAPSVGTSCPSGAQLVVSPSSGSTATLITITGSGVTPNGRVQVHFHADIMGTTDTDGAGCFRVRLHIPNQDFYAHFPGQRFDISVTEFNASGTYAGNGPGRQSFYLTG